jgi:site-specific DNA-methyltransferase (adenine-specific)
MEQELRYPSSIQKFNTEVGLHPTQKPVALMEYLIRTYTNEGETVLDFTMGSGTTGVACANTGRKFIGIERDPEYFAIAERRIAEAFRMTTGNVGVFA